MPLPGLVAGDGFRPLTADHVLLLFAYKLKVCFAPSFFHLRHHHLTKLRAEERTLPFPSSRANRCRAIPTVDSTFLFAFRIFYALLTLFLSAMSNINYKSGVAIGELVVYFPVLAIAVFLAVRHGFGRSSGWLYLIIFALVRIIGSCFQLATINDPTNISLYTGVAILQTIGLSPLELCSLGLLSRIISSINKGQPIFLQAYHMKLIQTIVMVGLILSIVGGIQASKDLSKTHVYTPQSLSQAAIGLFIASYVLIVASTIIISTSVSHAELGEKRLLLAVALSLPFLLVRLVYSSISLFTTNPDFNSVSGNVTIFLCMALIMELCAVTIYEVIGLTLRKIPSPIITETVAADEAYVKGPSKASQIASTLGRRTIIGRLVTSAMNGNDDNVEMQQPYGMHAQRQARRARRHGY